MPLLDASLSRIVADSFLLWNGSENHRWIARGVHDDFRFPPKRDQGILRVCTFLLLKEFAQRGTDSNKVRERRMQHI